MLQQILDRANFNVNGPVDNEVHEGPTVIDEDAEALFCFFSGQMAEVLDVEQLRELSMEAATIDTHSVIEEEYTYPRETPCQVVAKINRMRLPNYEVSLSPAKNVFEMGWVTETEEDFVTPEGPVPKCLPEAQALAYGSRLDPGEEDSPTIRDVVAGLPHLADALPNFQDDNTPLSKQESVFIEDYLALMADVKPNLYQVSFQPPEVLKVNFPDPELEKVMYPYTFLGSGEGTIFYAGDGIPPGKFKSLAKWLIKHDLVAPPSFVPIVDIHTVMRKEPEDEELYEDLSYFEDSEMGAWEDVEENYYEGQAKSTSKKKDFRLERYNGPLWRSHIFIRGKKTPFRASDNILAVGKLKEVKKTYPHIAIAVSKVNPKDLKSMCNAFGRYLQQGGIYHCPTRKLCLCSQKQLRKWESTTTWQD
jgi:hypothetical protein